MSETNGKPMKHIIDQATFDEAVKENVELLDMEPEEAIIEAKTQFTSQNVDLSNIITDAYLYNGIENHPFVKNFNRCKELFQEDTLKEQEIIGMVQSVVQDIESDKAKKLYVGNNGGYAMGVSLLRDLQPDSNSSRALNRSPHVESDVLELTIVTYLKSVLTGYPDLLTPKDAPLFLSILERYVASLKDSPSDVMVSRLLDLISATLVLHENNRELWSSTPLLLDLLSSLPSSTHYNCTLRMLRLLRAMTLDDDIRVEVANTHERVRKFSDRFLPDLTRMVRECDVIARKENNGDVIKENVSVEKKIELASLLLRTVASLVVRNEHCAIVAENGGVGAVQEMTRVLLTQTLEESTVSGQTVELCIALMSFVKTIAGNDDVKNAIGESGFIELVVELVSTVRDKTNVARPDCVNLYETYLLLLATLTLRHAGICAKLVEQNIFDAIVGLTRENLSNAKIVKYGSWTLRNICSRNKPAVETLLDMGGAEVLQTALQWHPAIAYDVKSALKEFGDAVDVKLEEQWTGKGQLNFKPEF